MEVHIYSLLKVLQEKTERFNPVNPMSWNVPICRKSSDYFKTLIKEAQDNRLNFVSDNIPSLLSRASVIISSSSSAIFEAFSLGIPVGIMANNSGVSLNPLPKDLSESSLIYNEAELIRFIATNINEPKKRKNNGETKKSRRILKNSDCIGALPRVQIERVRT